MEDNGYETNKAGFSIGTVYEQYENTFFTPSLKTQVEDLTTSSKASDNLKKQSGNYFLKVNLTIHLHLIHEIEDFNQPKEKNSSKTRNSINF